ncbi:hypothetical protein MAR_010379, partial [Mya arenaria]
INPVIIILREHENVDGNVLTILEPPHIAHLPAHGWDAPHSGNVALEPIDKQDSVVFDEGVAGFTNLRTISATFLKKEIRKQYSALLETGMLRPLVF